MPVLRTIEKGRVPVRIWTDDIEDEALRQLINVSQLPIVHSHVAAMPDVHAGIGATVGSVIPTKGAIIPAAVGVDIGCGMNAVRLTLGAEQSARQPGARARCHRGRGAGRLRAARLRQGAGQRPCARRTSAVRSARPHRRQASRHRQDAEALRANLDRAARLARRRQSLHRAVPRRGRARLGDAALRLARHRQRDRDATSSPPRARTWSAISEACPTAISPTSAKARHCSTTTSRRWSGRRTTRRPTAAG